MNVNVLRPQRRAAYSARMYGRMSRADEHGGDSMAMICRCRDNRRRRFVCKAVAIRDIRGEGNQFRDGAAVSGASSVCVMVLYSYAYVCLYGPGCEIRWKRNGHDE